MQPDRPPGMHNWQLAAAIAASLMLTGLALVRDEADLGALLCAAVGLLTGLFLIIVAVASPGRRRALVFSILAIYLSGQILLLTHYALIRTHVRWLLLSQTYAARVLKQPPPADGDFRQTAWDGWGYGGQDTSAYLVFDPTNSLAAFLDKRPPINARGLPCSVAHVTRLENRWYAVTFYTDVYWGHGICTARMTRSN